MFLNSVNVATINQNTILIINIIVIITRMKNKIYMKENNTNMMVMMMIDTIDNASAIEGQE